MNLNVRDRVEFSLIVKYPIESKTVLFSSYLSRIWQDLSTHNKGNQKGISKISFADYYELPGIINTRLFTLFDKNKDDYLNYNEFSRGMHILFSADFQKTSKFIFEFLDFDEDGKITKEDTSIVMCHLFSKTYLTKTNQFSYKGLSHDNNYQEIINLKEDIERLNKKFFEIDEIIDYDRFLFKIQNVSSEIFVHLLMFLYANKPFNDYSLNLFENYYHHRTDDIKCNQITITQKEKENFLIAYPESYSNLLQSPNMTVTHHHKESEEYKSNITRATKLFRRIIDDDEYTEAIDENITINSIKITNYNINNFNNSCDKKGKNKSKIAMTTNSENVATSTHIEFTEISESSDIDDNYELETEASWKAVQVNYIKKGYIYRINNHYILQRSWFVLSGKDLFVFTDSLSKHFHKFIHLSSCVLQVEDLLKLNGSKYFCFSLIFPRNKRKFLFKEEREYNNWLAILRNICKNDHSLFQNYKFGEVIGKGNFGIVKEAVHLETKQKVAIKIIKKRLVGCSQTEVFRNEMEILKLCRHPNLINLLEIHENQYNLYLITELCDGGNLNSLIDKTHPKLNEKHVFNIIHQISTSLKYLSHFGIVHRDIKPENILIKEKSSSLDNLQIKIIDFGLAKILGPKTLCDDPFGTVSYIAPEILLGDKYNSKVDMWSLGVLTYQLFCGKLPFDHPYMEDEIIYQIIHKDPDFKKKRWDDFSTLSKHFVENLLLKDSPKRFSIEEVFRSPWFNIHCASL